MEEENKNAGPKHDVALSLIEEKYVLPFWDALIIATASQSEASKILTEDLSHGQTVEGVLIENPFLYG